jgi:hypothetical protein
MGPQNQPWGLDRPKPSPYVPIVSQQAEFLAHLRAEFPHFGIIADFQRPIWMAVRGHILLKAGDGVRLRELLREVTNR